MDENTNVTMETENNETANEMVEVTTTTAPVDDDYDNPNGAAIAVGVALMGLGVWKSIELGKKGFDWGRSKVRDWRASKNRKVVDADEPDVVAESEAKDPVEQEEKKSTKKTTKK